MSTLYTDQSTTNSSIAPPTKPWDGPVACVFCGASPGTSPVHAEAARALAHVLHEKNYRLVYGGGTVGVMGELAKTLVSLSGPDAVHGIIPKPLLRAERAYIENGRTDDPQKIIDQKTYGRTTVVADMHTRKRMMAHEVVEGTHGSGFVALSGGYGTLEELMEVVTWNQLGIHGRGTVAFNVDGYWDGLFQWVGKAVESGFITESNQRIMVEAKDAEEVVEALQNYKVSEGRLRLKWDEL